MWDRDAESNKGEIVLKTLNTFSSALDNDYDMNGLLLLSYPCIEIFELSNFDKRLWKENFASSGLAKKKMKDSIPKLTSINEKTLLLAVENMHRIMKNYGILQYDSTNFKKENLQIFINETNEYLEYGYFNALSLVSIMLIDLGLIIEKND